MAVKMIFNLVSSASGGSTDRRDVVCQCGFPYRMNNGWKTRKCSKCGNTVRNPMFSGNEDQK